MACSEYCGSSSSTNWWTRSANWNNINNFCYINSSGNWNNNNANNTNALALGFPFSRPSNLERGESRYEENEKENMSVCESSELRI